jgi:hypothetical protein
VGTEGHLHSTQTRTWHSAFVESELHAVPGPENDLSSFFACSKAREDRSAGSQRPILKACRELRFAGVAGVAGASSLWLGGRLMLPTSPHSTPRELTQS